MVRCYLPPSEGFFNFPGVSVESSTGVDFVAPRGYRITRVSGGVMIRRLWWRALLDKVLPAWMLV